MVILRIDARSADCQSASASKLAQKPFREACATGSSRLSKEDSTAVSIFLVATRPPCEFHFVRFRFCVQKFLLFFPDTSEHPMILQTNFPNLKLLSRGKVRDIYDLGDHLLIVASDRISAFDVILPQGIPHKGRVLTQISVYWFKQTADLIENHLVSANVDEFPEECRQYASDLLGRSMLVKKTQPLPVECIVRGYLSGSGWNEYKQTGAVCGIKLPAGLVESAKLDTPIFTPSTKAEQGVHDENITFARTVEIVGQERSQQLRDFSIAIYQRGRDLAESRGIIIADTKMEFGMRDGKLMLIDELMTPDSSRFWPMEGYQPGGPQPSFDKQYVRDYLLSINWNKKPPAPDLPVEVVRTTSEKYLEALERLAV